MHRRIPRTHLQRAALLTALALTACSSAPEQPILNQFFTASRLRDNTSLENFSLISFDPAREGVVNSFDITSVSPERRTPINVKALARALEDAKAEDTAYNKRKTEFYAANEEAVVRALKAEREKSKLKGKDAEVLATWTRIREEGSQVSRKIGDAKGKLAAESSIAQISLADQAKRPDLTKYDGEMVSKDVIVSAPVKLPGGQTTQKTMVITMQRAIVKADRDIAGRWIITALKDAGTAPGTKTS
jgi:hypothetical protein